MMILCVYNTPIMLQSVKENAMIAFPLADGQTFLAAESAVSACIKEVK